METRQIGRRAILEWSLCTGLLLLGGLTLLSIDFLALPVVPLACILAAWRNRIWPEIPLGLLLGTAGICGVVAFLNLGYRRCEPGRAFVPPGVLSHCGENNPLPWLLASAIWGGLHYPVFDRGGMALREAGRLLTHPTRPLLAFPPRPLQL